MTAEYSLRAALDSTAPITVSSAGTIQAPHPIVPFVADYLQAIDIDISGHQPTLITRERLEAADHAIAMDYAHQKTIAERFGVQLPLFSQFAYGRD